MSLDISGLETRVAVTTSAVRFYVLNSEAGSLADAESRRAVLAAVNRVELQELGTDQNVAPMDGLLGPSMAGYQIGACGAVCDHDVVSSDGDTGVGSEAGDRLVPLRLQITYTGDEQRATAAVIARQLSAAGIDAEQSELEPEELALAIVAGETDMFAFGWVAPATSGDAVLPPLLAVDSPANVARIASPEVEQLLMEASVTADDASRWALLDKAHRSALAEALILPIGGSTSILVTAPETPSITVRADGSIDLDSPH
jgi:ABC-type transport system substrate-binding protein